MTEGKGIRTARNGLKARILDFYAASPEAELSHSQIAKQFGVTTKSIERVVGELRALKVIESAYVHRLSQGVTVQSRPKTRDQLRAEKRAEKERLAALPMSPQELKRKESLRKHGEHMRKPLSWDFKTGATLQDVWAGRVEG